MKIPNQLKWRLIWAGLAFVVIGCSRKAPESLPVAYVGDRTISSEMFAFTYELSPRSITEQPPERARQTVLNNLINRILLAQEAEHRGLDQNSRLQELENYYLRQAVNRELYRQQVREKVIVTEDEEREAFNHSKKTLWVRHFVADDTIAADRIIAGENHAPHIPIHPWMVTKKMAQNELADSIGWNTVDPVIEAILYQLKPGQFSRPVFYGKKYHVFHLIDVIQNVMKLESDFQQQRESIHGVLKRRKEKALSIAFVYARLTPEHLVIKATVLNQLTDFLWSHKPAPVKNGQLDFIPEEEIRLVDAGEGNLAGQVLAVYRSGEMTVRKFLFLYKVNPQKMDFDDRTSVLDAIQNMVGFYVRDRVLSDYGLSLGLDSKPEVRQDFQEARDRLLAELLQHQMVASVLKENLPESTMSARCRSLQNALLDSLRQNTIITTDTSALMAVYTSDEGMSRKMDFTAIRTQQ
ncbi:MAG: hypothetical protein K9N34_10895 [Candidatus Marinimicrobia bacterium]|nr:hypothetical protein [Candidatus Neomarinimicrobiota bacterium]MCF7841177.1 hypothetical protein [Candidatus Neomarinimicrobiota bacterium]MCF7902442.1 hypothetical protein [Candidatus Neomarinimicrobiota bacterium]